jgi:hypothetical protein
MSAQVRIGFIANACDVSEEFKLDSQIAGLIIYRWRL